MNYFHEIKSYEVEKYFRGKTIQCEVTISVSEDETPPEGDFDFGDADENQAYLNRFKSGELFMGVVRVRAKFAGYTGEAYLAGCHLHAYPGPCDTDTIDIANDHSLVDEAFEDLKRILDEAVSKLKKFS